MKEANFHKSELMRVALVALVALVSPALGDPGQGDSKVSAAPSPSQYAVINQIGEAGKQVRWLEDKLLARQRATDPFGIAIRGKFKGLLVQQHANTPAQAVKPANPLLTLEKAILQLPIGAVNVANREALIGNRSVHEGDLLVLELSGRQFVVWIESIDRRGVQFCDINLQNHALRSFRFGPTELPQNSEPNQPLQNSATKQSNVRDFLKTDGN